MYYIFCGLQVSAVLTWLAAVWTWFVFHPSSPRYSNLSAPRHADVLKAVLIAEALLQFRLWFHCAFQKQAFICKVLGKLKLDCLLVFSGQGWKFIFFVLLFISVLFCWFGWIRFFKAAHVSSHYSLFTRTVTGLCWLVSERHFWLVFVITQQLISNGNMNGKHHKAERTLQE